MQTVKNRLDYIDLSKGFTIILVVLGHIYQDNYIRTWLYSFHIPLFFIISGILLNYKDINNNNFLSILETKIKSIMIPYFCFEALNIIIWLINNKEFTISALRWNIIDTILLYAHGTTWFLPCLFIAEIIFIIIRKIIKNDYFTIITCILITTLPFVLNLGQGITLIIFRSCIALGFICLGYFIYPIQKDINLSKIKISIIFCINIILCILNGRVDLYKITFNNVILYFLCAFLGSISILMIFKNIKFNRGLSYFGKNSLIIMCVHNNLILILQSIFKFSYDGYVKGLILLIIVMIIQIPIIEIINRYLPFMIGKKRIKIRKI